MRKEVATEVELATCIDSNEGAEDGCLGLGIDQRSFLRTSLPLDLEPETNTTSFYRKFTIRSLLEIIYSILQLLY